MKMEVLQVFKEEPVIRKYWGLWWRTGKFLITWGAEMRCWSGGLLKGW